MPYTATVACGASPSESRAVVARYVWHGPCWFRGMTLSPEGFLVQITPPWQAVVVMVLVALALMLAIYVVYAEAFLQDAERERILPRWFRRVVAWLGLPRNVRQPHGVRRWSWSRARQGGTSRVG